MVDSLIKSFFEEEDRKTPVTPRSVDPAIEAFFKRDKERLDTENAIRAGSQSNPDDVAKAAKLSKERKLPQDVVERNLRDVERKAEVDRWVFGMGDDIDTHPKTAKHMRTGDNARVAHDDGDNMSAIEVLSNIIKGIGEEAFSVGKGAQEVVDEVTFGGATILMDAFDTLRTAVGLRDEGRPFTSKIEELDLGYKEMTTWDEFKDSPVKNFIPFALEKGLISAPDMALAVLNLPTFVAAQTGRLARERAKNDQREEATVADLLRVLPFSVSSAMLERIGARGILGIDDKLLGTGLKEITKAVGKGAFKETITEAGQEGLEAFATTAGTKRGVKVEDIAEAMLQGGVVGAGFGGTVRSITATAEAATKSAKAKRQLAHFDAMAEKVAESKYRERDPEGFREFAGEVTEGAKVYVDFDAMNTYFQSENFDPLAFENIEDLQDALEEGSVSGVVALDMADFQTYIAPSEAYNALREDIKFAVDDLTANEARQHEQDIEAILDTEYDIAVEQERQAGHVSAVEDAVFLNVYEQLINTGATPDIARTQAALHKAHAFTLRESYNIDPMEFYGEFAIRGAVPESVLNVPVDELDLTIERARRGGADPDNRALFGESLQDMARRLGIRDDRGDLAAADVDKGLAPFTRRMLRPNDEKAAQLDDIFQAAEELGFFPGATEAEIRDLVLEGLTGEDVFIPGGVDLAEQGRRQAAQDLLQVMDRVGVDISQASNQDIREALRSITPGQITEAAFDQAPPVDSDAFKEWSGGAEVIEPEFINDEDFRGDGPYVLRVFHGTTHRFEVFDPTKRGSIGAQFGRVNYFTSSQHDASANYGATGPDITNNIEIRAEQLEQEMEFDPAAFDLDEDADFAAEARDRVRSDMVGPDERVLDLYVRTDNPFVIGGHDQRFIEFGPDLELEKEAEQEVMSRHDITVEEMQENRGEYQDEIDEYIWEEMAIRENPIVSAIDTVARRHDWDPGELLAGFYDTFYDDADHTSLEQFFRENESLQMAEDYELQELDPQGTALFQSEFIAEVIQELGFDSIILKDADQRFGNMGMEPGTAHVHLFGSDASKIKSATDNRGTFSLDDPNILNQAAFHGTPHLFEKFSTDHIGTGEGAQAFGWGLYFAGRKEVAQYYREALSSPPAVEAGEFTTRLQYKTEVFGRVKKKFPDVEASELATFTENMTNALWARAEGGGLSDDPVMMNAFLDDQLQFQEKMMKPPFEGKPWNVEVIREMQKMPYPTWVEDKGRLLEVDIPSDDQLLDYDKPLSEQPGAVKERLESLNAEADAIVEAIPVNDGTDPDWLKKYEGEFERASALRVIRSEQETGAQIYRNLAQAKGGDRAASEALAAAGIPGHRFLDGSSRGKGEGTHNYVIYDDKVIDVVAFEQRKGEVRAGIFAENARGEIRNIFDDDATATIIQLTEAADLTSFIHESGHFFVRNIAKIAESNKRAERDLNLMMDFAGVSDVEGFRKRDPQEKLARAFEAYVREGKAPSAELEGAFARMRAWLVNIYRTLRGLNVKINDDIRGVFDRMLATDDQIMDAAIRNGYYEMPGLAATMTDKQRADYEEAAQRAQAAAFDALEKQKIAEETRETRARWKAELKEAEAEMRERVNQTRVYQVIDAIMDRSNDAYLSRDAVVDMLGAPEAKLLNRAWIRKEGGAHPDNIAEQFGYTSGHEMLLEMMSAAQNKKQREELIKRQANDVMKDRHGDLSTNEAQAAEAASEAVRNDERARFFNLELKALAAKTDKKPTPISVAKAAAKQIIARKKVGDVSEGRYAQASARAGKEATRALLKNDFEAARDAKFEQILNHYLAREARKRREAAESKRARLSKWQRGSINPKNVHPEFIKQIKATLGGLNFGSRVSQKRFDKMSSETLLAWMESMENKDDFLGVQFVMPKDLETALEKDWWGDMTMEELDGLHDVVSNLMAQGRRYSEAEARQLDSLIMQAVASVEDNATKVVVVPSERSFLDKAKGNARLYWAEQRRIDALSQELDGGEVQGSVFRNVYQPVKRANDRYIDRSQKAGSELHDILKMYSTRERLQFFNRQYIPEIQESLSLSGRLSFALNWGNEGNREALLATYSEEQVQAVLRTLEPRDWDVVEAIWENIDQYWPELSALEEKVKGVKPAKVEASPFTLPDGREIRGGYYPLIADPEATIQGRKDFEERHSLKGFGAGGHSKNTTEHSSTIERKGFGKDRKVWLDLNVVFQHVDGVIKDIEMREAVVTAHKIINDTRFAKSVRDAKGPEFHEMYRNWLQNVVGEEKGAVTSLEKVIQWARTGVSLAEMGLSLRTMLQQPFGITQTFAVIGEKNTAIGLAKFAGNPSRAAKEVMEQSAFMRNRGATFNRDVRDAQRMLGISQINERLSTTAFWGIQKLDMGVSVPTWLGAHNQATQELGLKDQDAIDYADNIVSRTQGSGLPRDMADIQQGKPWKRLFTMFYTFFSSYYNMQTDQIKQTNFKDARSALKFAKNQIWLTVIPSLVVDALFNASDDDEEWYEWAGSTLAAYGLSGMVGVRDIANAAMTGYGFQITPAMNVGKAVINTASKGAEATFGDGEFDATFWQNLAMTVGYVGHVPGARAVNRAIRTLSEDDEMDSFEAWWNILVQGPDK